MKRTFSRIIAAVVVAFALSAAADGNIKPGSSGDTWSSATSRDDKGEPIIHSLRSAALDLTNRGSFRWRIGISWRFHPTESGMPASEDRAPMTAIDDAIHADFERDDANRIVYFTTGGGIREVMLYGTSDAVAWQRVDALFKRFPKVFPGDRRRYAYVEKDPDWQAYRAIAAKLRPPAK